MKYRKLSFIMILMAFVLCDFIIIFFPKNENKILRNTYYYDLNISHPVTRVKDIDVKINNYIDDEIKSVKKLAEKKKNKYKLNIDYKKYIFNNIITIELDSNIAVKDKVVTSDKSFYRYNSKDQSIIDFSKMFNSDLEPLKKISSIIKKEFSSNFNNYYFDIKCLHIILDDDYLIDLAKIKNIINFDYIYGDLISYNDIKDERDIEFFKDKKLICFTFDDGPASDNTNKLLDELKKRDARATFFVLGNRVKNQSNIVKRMYMEGHTIGNHSYDHARLINLGKESIEDNLNKSKEAIKSVTGSYPLVTRPPYGAHNETVDNIIDTPIILWSVDPMDWKYRDSNIVRDNIINNVTDGSIVLVHDLYPTSIEGALQALDILKTQGYYFVSIEEMFKIKGIDINGKGYYRHFN